MKAIELYNELEPTFKLIVQGYNLFDKYQTDKHRKIVTSFHRNILDGNESEERIKYEQENIKANQDDYFTLLKFAIEDEEEEKVDIYTNVYKYIRDNQHLEKSLKMFLLKAAKDMPFSAIELLPKIYIHQEHHTKLKNLNDYLKGLYISNIYEVSILEKYTLINKGKGSFGPYKYNVSKKHFTLVVNSFFGKENILPEKYEVEIWKERKAIILYSNEPSHDLLNKIKSILYNLKISYDLCSIDDTSIISCYSHVIIPISDLKDDKFNVSDLKSNSKLLKVTCTNIIGRNDILYLDKKEHLEEFEYTLNRFPD
ncbi:hypothetical protein AF79_08985 [Aliarcobacter butzleri L354]|uniref:hypothetical protein n=1 Tax=Aliarcobacter butzleri TaxID=28197 RepID=UPI00063AF997|nr:hypothetical protein [Aliarcobacter butzleri]KLE08085.1 hypothetical protein AF79_08985 [Aliarcobacter butzleri L354]